MDRSNPLILRCCGNVIDSNWMYKGHAKFHLQQNQKAPCSYPGCHHQATTEDNLTRHMTALHPDVPKHILGLENPPKANKFQIMHHLIENDMPITRNIFSHPMYKSNPINEQYIDNLNSINRSQNEDIASRIDISELDQSEISNPPIEEQLNADQIEVENEDLLQQREEITNSFDHVTLDQQLSSFQIDLADGYNKIKDSNVITDSALKSACFMMLEVFCKNFSIGEFCKSQALSVIKSDYILQKRRNVTKHRSKDFGENGKVYYFDIKDYLQEMIKNDLIWSKLLAEKNKTRDDNIIETIHDLEKVKIIDNSIGEKEINVFYNLWFDDFNTSTRTFGNTSLSTVLLSMASIDYKFTSKRHSAGLVALSKTSTRDNISIMTYFEDIRDQIKNMQSVMHNGYKVFFRFFLR